MHYMDANNMHKEKARWELHKNATSYFEQILDAATKKPHLYGYFPLISKNYPSKTNKTCETLLEKQAQTHKWRFMILQHRCASKNLFKSALCGHS